MTHLAGDEKAAVRELVAAMQLPLREYSLSTREAERIVDDAAYAGAKRQYGHVGCCMNEFHRERIHHLIAVACRYMDRYGCSR